VVNVNGKRRECPIIFFYFNDLEKQAKNEKEGG
jgi:hypothetical protein